MYTIVCFYPLSAADYPIFLTIYTSNLLKQIIDQKMINDYFIII